MAFASTVALSLLVGSLPAVAQNTAPPRRDVTLTAGDGTSLKATYYAASRPGPAVLLLHMCNTTRQSWEPLAPHLAAAGIHTLTLDYRGFGESGGERYDRLSQQDGLRTERPGGGEEHAGANSVAKPKMRARSRRRSSGFTMLARAIHGPCCSPKVSST